VLPLRTWNWYEGLRSANLPADFAAVSRIGSVTCVPPLGDRVLGVEAFSVDPSAAASAPAGSVVEGDTGVSERCPQATRVNPARIVTIATRVSSRRWGT
jgi:hypothetical protein